MHLNQNKTRTTTSTSVNVLEVPVNAVKLKAEISTEIEKEVKLSLCADDMIVYLKETQKNSLKNYPHKQNFRKEDNWVQN